jgi:alcohol dehydrogenase class IV
VRLASAFGIEHEGRSTLELAKAAIDFVSNLNRELHIPELSTLIRLEDLDILAEKAAANTSRPSNPRDADRDAFRAMFERSLAG